ncbi:MAG: hypothetical protein NT069_23035 [Planctomycetota bacterium]|nr:hypothetical protein [Planctomycetota bacterium]
MRHGSRYRRPLGLMFDTGASDTDGRPREGCAIAYRRVGTDPRAYLRTVAHELGHVFNLGHPGEGLEPFGQDSFNTLMVPTESLNPARAEFRFTESQRDWLANGPEDYVRPGGQEYGTRPADWRPGGNGIAAPAGVPLDNGPGWS